MSTKHFRTFGRIGHWLVRIAPRVGFGLLVLFGLAAIPWTYFNIKWGRPLEVELAALKAQGMPLTLAEAAPEPVPDDQNAALVYNEVFQVQSDIAEEVIGQLDVTLLGPERNGLESRPTDNLDAYQAFLQGIHFEASAGVPFSP